MENIFAEIDLFQIISVIFRTLLIFLYAFFLLRFLGRRRLNHITYLDILLIISFGSAVGDVMIYGESVVNFWVSALAPTIVSIVVKILDEISSHSKIGSKILEGNVTLLINNGFLVERVLEKENLTKSKINSILRERDVEKIEDVKKAFIEPDGEISIILKK